MRVLVILGHPRIDSFCAAMAARFRESLEDRGIEFREIVVARLSFDLNVRQASIHGQTLEPDLGSACEDISWADHLVFVYPVWWGTMPALLKGFLDRVLLPGFSFRERADGGGFEGLLHGKSAQLLTTLDTPPWVMRWILRQPGHRALAVATLGFCGVHPVRIRLFGPVKHSTARQRRKWLDEAAREAAYILDDRFSGPEAFRHKVMSWIRALRLQFHPMTWLAYTAGATLAVPLPGLWRQPAYWWGYLLIFLIEAITVFLNELHDFESDRRNAHHGLFSGGSRVLVEKRLSTGDLWKGCRFAAAAALAAGFLMQSHSPAPAWANAACFATALFLGAGYTVPPLKFSHRGAGEGVVAFTHSLLVIQCGSLVLGGPVGTMSVWQMGLPLFLAVVPSITLSGLPDREADEAAGKRTLAVKFGSRAALSIAVFSAAAAILLVLSWAGPWPAWALAGIVAHGMTIAAAAAREWNQSEARRINGLMILTLSFMLWFVLVPLLFPR